MCLKLRILVNAIAILNLSALFITQAKVWLLDEPFTALDADGINVIETQITKHCDNGGICVLTTHQKSNLHGLRTLTL